MKGRFVLHDPDLKPSDFNEIAEGTGKTIHVKFTSDKIVIHFTNPEELAELARKANEND